MNLSVQYSGVMQLGVDDMNCGAWQCAISEHGEYRFFGHTKNVLSQAGALTGNENQVEGSPWRRLNFKYIQCMQCSKNGTSAGNTSSLPKEIFSNILNSIYLKLFDY